MVFGCRQHDLGAHLRTSWTVELVLAAILPILCASMRRPREAQKTKVLAAKPDDLSPHPRTHIAKGETWAVCQHFAHMATR